jgi:hypothetical protein
LPQRSLAARGAPGRGGSRPGFLLEPQRSAWTSAADSIIGHGAAEDTGSGDSDADKLKSFDLTADDLYRAAGKAEKLVRMSQREIVLLARALTVAGTLQGDDLNRFRPAPRDFGPLG